MPQHWAKRRLEPEAWEALNLAFEDIERGAKGDPGAIERLSVIARNIGAESLAVMHAAKTTTGIEAMERKLAHPVRSGKVVLPLVCAALAAQYRNFDTRIGAQKAGETR